MSAYFASLLVLATAGHATATRFSATCGSGTTPATAHIFSQDDPDCNETTPRQGGNASATGCVSGIDWSTKITCDGSTVNVLLFTDSRNCSGAPLYSDRFPAGECVDLMKGSANRDYSVSCDSAHAQDYEAELQSDAQNPDMTCQGGVDAGWCTNDSYLVSNFGAPAGWFISKCCKSCTDAGSGSAGSGSAGSGSVGSGSSDSGSVGSTLSGSGSAASSGSSDSGSVGSSAPTGWGAGSTGRGGAPSPSAASGHTGHPSQYCGHGTLFDPERRQCVASYEGVMAACRNERGDWDFTCEPQTEACSENNNNNNNNNKHT